MTTLEGKVAVVAGATRGAGRGIARALGEQGATVYCTGRSVRGNVATEGRTETIEETAELVTKAGGHGIGLRVDHTKEPEVKALFERVAREQDGRLDVLVNDVWGGDALAQWGTPFWEMDLSKGFQMLDKAVNAHLITSRHGVPLLVARKQGLVVEITDGNGWNHRGELFYDLCKTTAIRLAWTMAEELRAHGVAAVAVTPGFLRSEAMLDLMGLTKGNWRETKDPDFLHSETPLFVGRAVAALAADPRIMQKSGRVFASWDLSDEYGFTDEDGTRPHWGRHAGAKYPGLITPLDDAFYAYGEGYHQLKALIEEKILEKKE